MATSNANRIYTPLTDVIRGHLQSLGRRTMQVHPGSAPPNPGIKYLARLVSSQGAVVLGTGAHTYDRFVRDVGFCERYETTEPG